MNFALVISELVTAEKPLALTAFDISVLPVPRTFADRLHEKLAFITPGCPGCPSVTVRVPILLLLFLH